jgi:cytoskeleton protein RodZ
MKAGETFPVPSRPNLVLNTGNAGRVEILVDGVLVPAIGNPGTVRRDVPLDPDPLKAGLVVPVSTRH